MRTHALMAALLGLVVAGVHPASAAVQRSEVGSMAIPDGDGWANLELESLAVEVKIAGRFARTRVTHVFRSHVARQSEGVFTIQLPPGAAITRLDMNVGATMMAGELVEWSRARAIYEGIVAKERDPALMEHQGGGRFKTRIFPIPAKGTKTVVLEYATVLEGRGALLYRYRLPRLASGKRSIGTFRLAADVSGAKVARIRGLPAGSRRSATRVAFARRRFRPRGSISIQIRRRGAEVYSESRRGERFFATTIVPPAKAVRELRDVILAVDTSRSVGAAGVARAVATGKALVAALPARSRIGLVHGDYRARACSAQPVPRRRVRSLWRCLAKVTPGGGSDLRALLDAAIDHARLRNRPSTIVLLSDGVPSLGKLDHDDITHAMAMRINGRDIVVHTVDVGTSPEPPALGAIARAGGGDELRVKSKSAALAAGRALASAARRGAVTDLELVATGARELVWFPRERVRPGQPIVVMGKTAADRVHIRLRARFRRRRLGVVASVRPGQGTGASLSAVWARARIGALDASGAPSGQIVAASRRYGVMSRYTSFLVLENERAYKRYAIERRKAGKRARWGVRLPTPPTHLLARRARVPRIRIGASTVAGDLDKRMIRRVLRRARSRIRYCYNRQLLGDPDLAGTIRTRFVIAASGRVVSSTASAPGAGMYEVAACVARVIETLRFPAVPGERYAVEVRYPFRFAVAGRRPRKGPHAPAERLRWLERRLVRLSLRQQGQLVELWLGSKKPKSIAKAWRLIARRVATAEANRIAPRTWLPLVWGPLARKHFPGHFRQAAIGRLTRPAPPPALLDALFDNLIDGGEPQRASIPALLGRQRLSPERGAYMLERLVSLERVDLARSLWAGWRRARWKSTDLYVALVTSPRTARAMRAEVLQASAALLRAGSLDADVFDRFVAAAIELGATTMASNAVLRRCTSLVRERDECTAWLREVSHDARARERLRALYTTELSRLQSQLVDSPGDTELCEKAAKALRVLGRDEEALRLLSEIPEAEPRSKLAYESYADALLETGFAIRARRARAAAARIR